jgi:Kef-type K+ transport system membrane component KefB
MPPIAASSQDVLLATLLLDLAVIAACALAFGALAQRVGQAVVVGEIVAGLLLGPSLLGVLPGHLDELLFPAAVRPYLQLLASVALVLFMFGIGFEVDIERIRRSGRDVMRIGAASVLLPVIAAVAIAPLLWAAHHRSEPGVSEMQFVAFMAIVLSVTALPVLARVLADAQLFGTPLGELALVVAAMTDLVSWIALAALLSWVGATGTGMPLGALMLWLAALFVVLMLVVRPLLLWGLEGPWYERYGPRGASLLLLVALTLCAAATTHLGLHPAFGAFALGVACPRRRKPSAVDPAAAPLAAAEGRSARAVSAADALSGAGLVLVPLYFIVTGLKVDATNLGLDGLVELCALLVVATASKVGSVRWAALRCGHDRREALALGLLLNTRGLTELIVLDIGRSAGVIDGRLFTVLVLVAIITTAMTTPLLPLALRRGGSAADRLPVPQPASELSGS